MEHGPMMIQPELASILVTARQDYLRALASSSPGTRHATPRRSMGMMLIRLGRWLEGRYPDLAPEMPLAAGIEPGR